MAKSVPTNAFLQPAKAAAMCTAGFTQHPQTVDTKRLFPPPPKSLDAIHVHTCTLTCFHYHAGTSLHKQSIPGCFLFPPSKSLGMTYLHHTILNCCCSGVHRHMIYMTLSLPINCTWNTHTECVELNQAHPLYLHLLWEEEHKPFSPHKLLTYPCSQTLLEHIYVYAGRACIFST